MIKNSYTARNRQIKNVNNTHPDPEKSQAKTFWPKEPRRKQFKKVQAPQLQNTLKIS